MVTRKFGQMDLHNSTMTNRVTTTTVPWPQTMRPLPCEPPDNLDKMANRAADEAESKGYDVYVVFYEGDYRGKVDVEVTASFLEGLVRGAGQFRRTPIPAELEEMMFDLCTNFMELRLVM